MAPEKGIGFGVKKGAWTPHEDMLLKNCIEKYGERKWHLIPVRTGLNRCRKSCRLRWLNYLRPNIKRGDFAEDEVDLMLRLHKLLGNKWSMIAGRIPGRTANDVKNYWNTHIFRRSKGQKKNINVDKSLQDGIVSVVKPQPQTISKTIHLDMSCNRKIVPDGCNNLVRSSNECSNNFNVYSLPENIVDDKINQCLDELVYDREMEIEGDGGWSFGEASTHEEALNVVEQEDDENNDFFDFSLDEVMRNLMDLEKL